MFMYALLVRSDALAVRVSRLKSGSGSGRGCIALIKLWSSVLTS